jgi:peptidoglycan/LPS O-acetylase OafA/YrhL
LALYDSSAARARGLDLIRAIAILWVMLFHFQYLRLPAVFHGISRTGWMGVDLFFVLSGYLIGSQLLRPYTKCSVPSLADFYTRRAFRILPAYLSILALYFVIPGFREAPGLSPLWQFLTFTENYRIDYFHDHAFSHVWSLCVEEHFYLILPVLVLVLMRKPKLWKVVALALAIFSLGVVVRGYVFFHDLKPVRAEDYDTFTSLWVMRIYYPTHTRLDGLLVGVLLASIKTFRPLWWKLMMARGHLLSVAGIVVSGFAIWIFRERLSLSGSVLGYPLLALGMGFLVAASVSPQSWLSRVRGFGFTATLAYSLYLIHKEIGHLDLIYLNRYVEPGGWVAFVVLFVSSFAAASLLYFTIERPFLRLRERLSPRKAAPIAESAVAR